ncbi:MAG: hypothetical protein HC860_08250 [Alkalinema sp. RU_4_3]|nr:hypothetical protein [Alkalinema sp. RU_4_3]
MQSLPIYSRLWTQVKQFPGLLSRGSDHAPEKSGMAAAALISGGIGAVMMMIIHHISDTNKDFEQILHKTIGAWMPGAVNADPMWGNIGSYAGKETVMLVGWLGSWALLHFALRDRQVIPRTMLFWMISLYAIATAMSWHPLFPYLPLQ